jgi:hypothetical protein
MIRVSPPTRAASSLEYDIGMPAHGMQEWEQLAEPPHRHLTLVPEHEDAGAPVDVDPIIGYDQYGVEMYMDEGSPIGVQHTPVPQNTETGRFRYSEHGEITVPSTESFDQVGNEAARSVMLRAMDREFTLVVALMPGAPQY